MRGYIVMSCDEISLTKSNYLDNINQIQLVHFICLSIGENSVY
jgi:hypothetical protein